MQVRHANAELGKSRVKRSPNTQCTSCLRGANMILGLASGWPAAQQLVGCGGGTIPQTFRNQKYLCFFL